MWLSIEDLPALNASLNGTSAALLVIGFLCIRRGKIAAHRACMLSAFVVSTIFLISYLTLRYYAGMTRFTGQGWIRPTYFSILISHTVLAAGIVPLILLTLWRAIRGRFDRHVRIARWTLPLWLYVSVTGVLVYWILYQLYPRM
jgi:putative membrane protein